MLIAKHIYKSYDSREILRGVDLSVADGEFVSIMGKSGSGKSTLLNTLAGNIRPNSGEVWLDGECVTEMNDKRLSALRRTKLGFVYQSLNLIPTLHATDNILLPLLLDRQSIAQGKIKLEALAEELEISHLLQSFPEEMSGGERQRVAIARAMIHDPSVLMLDEPTGSLDNRSTLEVMLLLQRLHRDHGVSVVQVTHSRVAAEYGDRIIHLSDGQVVDA